MKVLLFLGLWFITGNFIGALGVFLLLIFIFFIIQTFFGAVRELGLFTTILLFFSFSWLFDSDE